MKIINCYIKKFKVLSDFNAELQGQSILIMGENGLGKSSLISFIKIALGDPHIPPATEGEGVVVTSKEGKQYTLKVKILDGKSVVTVTGEDGLSDNRKSAIASICGAMSFDIDEFCELSKTKAGQKKQVDIFKSFLPAEIREQLNKYETHVATLYEERTETGRQMKKLEIEVQAHPLYGTILTQHKVDVNDIFQKLQAEQAKNNKRKEVENRLAEREKTIIKDLEEVKDIEAQIEALTKRAQKKEEEIKALRVQNHQATEYLVSNPLIDTSEYEKKIEKATESNEEFAQAERLRGLRKELDKVKEAHDDLNARVNSERQAISDTIKQMDSPVEGLEYSDDMLVYKGVPVSSDSLSASEIQELGIKLKLAENKDLGIVFLERAESLGQTKLQNLLDMAKKNDIQLILEQVERNKEKLEIKIINNN